MPARHITPAELDARIGQVHDLIGTLSGQLLAHEQWHRDMMTQAAAAGPGRRLAVWALAVSAAAAAAALVTAITALVR